MRKRSKKQRVLTAIIVIIILIAMVLTTIIAALPAMAKDKTSDETIQDGITVGGVDVSGMTKAEADNALSSYADSFGDTTFTIQSTEGKAITATGADLGITVDTEGSVDKAIQYGKIGNPVERFLDVKALKEGKTKDFPITFKTTHDTASAFLKDHEADIVTEPIDNSLTLSNGVFTFVPGQKGVRLKVDETIQKIDEALATDFDGSDLTIEAEADIEEPKGSEEELSQVKDALGTFSTSYRSSTSGRKINVELGASKINGKIVYPGETFSVAENLRPVTAANGYAKASAYENGTVIDSYGGGICQVSTTLYNAVIRAELEVVERSAHSMIVSYVQPSMDAAIAGEGAVKDFKFKNNQDFPVYIEGTANGGYITFTVYGKETRPSNRKVSFVSEILSQTDPTSSFTADPSQPIGSIVRTSDAPHTGYTARLMKIVTVDGVEQSRDVFNKSKYRATNSTYSVGTQSADPNATNAMNAAIATQDKATIEAAAAQHANAQAPAETPAETPAATTSTGTPTTPAATPAETPATPSSGTATPTETPAETPAATPAETPAATPAETPAAPADPAASSGAAAAQ